MSDFVPHIPGLSTCLCTECMLIRCGALDTDWNGWRWVDFAGEARVSMYLIVGREPVVWPGPRRRWAGCVPWFSTLGLALDFDDAGGDDDESA